MPMGGGHLRFDLVLAHDGLLSRVQVKTGRLQQDSVLFATSSTSGTGVAGSGRSHWRRKHYVADADYFGVYCPETKTSYLVPIDRCGLTASSLRVGEPPADGKRRLLAKDFTI